MPQDTRRRAAVVLEVLTGLRTCPQAAKELGLSLAAYYALEQRAMEGLVQSCQAMPKGRQKRPDDQIHTLERQCQKLKQNVLRYQALIRAQQRSTGLTTPPEPAKGKGKVEAKVGQKGGGRVKKPQVRALKVVKQLQTPQPSSPSAAATETVLPPPTAQQTVAFPPPLVAV